METLTNDRKVAIIGCGFVGSTTAFCLMQSGLFSEMVLIDIDQQRAEGEALDIAHGMPYYKPMNIYAGTYEDLADANIVIITAGVNQKPGETRLDLVQKNTAIFKTIIPEITKTSFNGILLVISNPVDILTYVTLKLSEYPTNRVIGSGTVLDSARLKCVIGERLDVDPRNVHARIVGEHGDSEFVLWSLANVSGVPINQYCELLGHFDHEESMKEVADHVKNSAYEIIEKKHATYYGIACAVKRICEAIIRDEKPILPISSYLEGEYGISDVVLSTPAIVGKNGLEYKVQVPINEEEQEKLEASAIALKEIIAQLDL
ncbi:l-lactate dehydrogenase [Eggerthella sp. CAG:368]|nr:l-lactate dehydrogenase [Eggerthella sp. CAG:368]